MIRKLKLFGAVLGAVIATGALTASAAIAIPQFTASSYPAQTTATGIAFLNTEAGWTECDVHVLGHSISASSSTHTLTKTYSNCVAFGFLNATVNTEGCAYVLHATEQVSGGVYNHHVDVVCPAGKSIKIEASTCKAEVKAQNNRTTVTTTNSGGSVTVQPNVKLDMVVTQDGFGCPFGGTGTKSVTEQGHVLSSRVGGGTISVSGS
jgi:hypothetical protein